MFSQKFYNIKTKEELKNIIMKNPNWHSVVELIAE
jgi:hypothetical protein